MLTCLPGGGNWGGWNALFEMGAYLVRGRRGAGGVSGWTGNSRHPEQILISPFPGGTSPAGQADSADDLRDLPTGSVDAADLPGDTR